MLRFDPGSDGSGNKSAFARRIGRTRQTIVRWLAKETDISSDSVYQVVERLQLSPQEVEELLGRIGGYIASSAPAAVPDPRKDPIIQEIMADPGLSEDQRAHLVKQQLGRIEADFLRRREEYAWLRRQLDERPA